MGGVKEWRRQYDEAKIDSPFCSRSLPYVNNNNNDDGDDDDDDGGGGRGQGVLKEGGLGASSRASVGEISVVYCLQFKVMT